MSKDTDEIVFSDDDGESIEFDSSENDDQELIDQIINSDEEYDGEEGGEEGETEEEEEEDVEVEEGAEVAEELPEWACYYCHNDDPSSVARCVTCGKWFCNAYCKTGSHIVKHMIFSEHRSISLHPNGLYPDFAQTPIFCLNNHKHTNMFTLGIIQNVQGYYSIICRDNCLDKPRLAELGWDADTWKHLINDRHIANFLLSDAPPSNNIRSVSDDDICGLEMLWKETPDATLDDYRSACHENDTVLEPIPLNFLSAQHYEDIFMPIINSEAVSDRNDNDSKCIEDVTLRWENGIGQTKIAVFHNNNMDNRYRMNVGQAVRLHLPISLYNTDDENIYNGKVIHVEDNEVHVEMNDKELPLGYTNGFRITFCWNGVVFDRMRAAIRSLIYEDSMSPYLYNKLMGNEAEPKPFPLLNLRSFSVPGMPELNNSQVTAVKASLQNQLTLIQGPPGTGKTWTSSTIVYHLVRGYKERVLVCAPSNIATDNLTIMIHKMGLHVVRVVARSRESVSSLVDQFCIHSLAPKVFGENSELARLHAQKIQLGQLPPKDLKRYDKLYGLAEDAILASAEVICCTCTVGGDERIRSLGFTNVLVDETTQAREPECLIPVVNGCKRLILVGDHEQLGPVILDQKARRAGFGVSLFERLLALGVIPYRLNVQYRMHPALSEFPSNTFYDGDLQNGINTAERTRNINFPWPRSDKPMMFWAVNGSEDPGSSGRSLQNRMEAYSVNLVVQKFLHCGISGSRIAVVTPYDSQRTLVRQLLYQNNQIHLTESKKVEVASVDEFQGREKDYIIFSCVRSNSNQEIGFLRDYRRLNVALTRAKYGIVIIGNPNTLKADPIWSSLLHFYQDQKCLVNGATLDNLSLYLIRIKQVDDLSRYTDRYGLAKKSRMLREGFEFANRQEMEEEEQLARDAMKDVHSSVTTAEIMGGAAVNVDFGDTGL